MIVLTILSSFFVLATGSDLFTAYNCQNPKDAHYVSHQECHRGRDVVSKEKYTIVQRQTVHSLNSFSCLGFQTTEVGFCGAYSHTKHTGESRFHVPLLFSKSSCNDMVTTKAYLTDTQSFTPTNQNNELN